MNRELDDPRRIRTIIYGSCVSRDTFEFLPDHFQLLTYVARQSAISAAAPAAEVLGRLKKLPSAFQDRMVRGDVRGDLQQVLRANSADTDLLLIDLVDERGGVLSLGGGYVTKLAEFWGAGGREISSGAHHVALGSEEHFNRWSAAMDAIVRLITELGLAQSTLVLQTPWAKFDPEGVPIPLPAWMIHPDDANRIYRRYFDHLADHGLAILRLPDDLATSPLDHRWGPSPFHYSAAAYQFLAEGIARFLESGQVSAQ